MKKDMEKLQPVSIRKEWPAEPEFSKWLSENIARLGDELGLSLEFRETEKSAGKFRIDIFAWEKREDVAVVIENQYGKTDHDHLGKCLTYAADQEAEFIIWLAEEVEDEHRAAMEWLNDQTGLKKQFYLVKIKVWKIGNSEPALQFVPVVFPNKRQKEQRTPQTPWEVDESQQNLIDHICHVWECRYEKKREHVNFVSDEIKGGKVRCSSRKTGINLMFNIQEIDSLTQSLREKLPDMWYTSGRGYRINIENVESFDGKAEVLGDLFRRAVGGKNE